MTSPPAAPAQPSSEAVAQRHRLDPLAGVLSYLVPGLGQISQGRIAKGVVFLVSLHALFFYGMWLGEGKNVYLPQVSGHKDGRVSRLLGDLYARPHFAGQFFIGVAAWPAVYQYLVYDPNLDADQAGQLPLNGFQRTPSDERLNDLQRNLPQGYWDLGWVYTVIAGVLNLLVIYDAIAGPAFREAPDEGKGKKEPAAA
jgi:hypothetical protein